MASSNKKRNGANSVSGPDSISSGPGDRTEVGESAGNRPPRVRLPAFSWLGRIADPYLEDLKKKFVRGAQEHGGLIWHQDIRKVRKELREELLDVVNYACVLVEREKGLVWRSLCRAVAVQALMILKMFEEVQR